MLVIAESLKATHLITESASHMTYIKGPYQFLVAKKIETAVPKHL